MKLLLEKLPPMQIGKEEREHLISLAFPASKRNNDYLRDQIKTGHS
jgi:hypothetical protein